MVGEGRKRVLANVVKKSETPLPPPTSLSLSSFAPASFSPRPFLASVEKHENERHAVQGIHAGPVPVHVEDTRQVRDTRKGRKGGREKEEETKIARREDAEGASWR